MTRKKEQKKIATRVLKGLREMHRCHLQDAMMAGDNEYATTMNAAFRLMERLER